MSEHADRDGSTVPSAQSPTVFKIPSPWSGDDNDPITTSYRVWFRAYVSVRRARHLVGIHDWRARPLGGSYCDWCGASR